MTKKIIILLIFSVNCTFAQLWVQQYPYGSLTPYSVSAVDNNVCWVCGSSGKILKTTNGGANWQLITISGTGLILYTIFGIDDMNALCGGTVTSPASSNIYRTTNGGSSWTTVFSQPNGFPNSIWMTSNLNGIMMGDPVGGRWTLFRTINGGASWDSAGLKLNSLSGEGGWNNGMMVISPNVWFVGGGSGNNFNRIYYSSNSGFNWSVQTVQMPFNIPNGSSIWFNSVSTGIGSCATNDSGSFFTTTNGGALWNSTGIFSSTGTPYYYTGYGTNLWRGGGPYIFSSGNNGTNWGPVQQYTTPSNSFINHLQIARNGFSGWAVDNSGIVIKGYLGLPSVPVLISPPNGSNGQPLTPTLDWNDVQTPVIYYLQIALDSNFSSVVLGDSVIYTSQRAVGSGILANNTAYYWRVRGKTAGGIGGWSSIWKFTVGFVGIKTYSSEIPKEYKLYSNYPNPFNPSSRIRFDIPIRSMTEIKVYDLAGRLLQTLVNESFEAGGYEIEFNAAEYSSGVYLYSINTGNFSQTKKMIVLK